MKPDQNNNIQSDRVFGLIKFGKKEHMEEFVHTGLLYMNTVKYFKELESTDLLRSDKHEGAKNCIQADGAVFSVKKDKEWLELGKISGPIIGLEEH